MADTSADIGKREPKQSYSGIPEAEFMEDVDKFMTSSDINGNAELVIQTLDVQHSKYKCMELNLMSKRRRLKKDIPESERTIEMIHVLMKQKDSPENFETQFLLSSQVYMKASIPPTDKVCLWIGANVMLEYSLEDALDLVTKRLEEAKRSLKEVDHDLDFLRDQCTTTEVNMARVYNWNVKKRNAAKASA